MGQLLVVVQVTLSLALLAGAALFIRTLSNLRHLDAGFHADGVFALAIEATVPNPPAAPPASGTPTPANPWRS